ncbi:uncharacterized protein LOC106714953 [Papilio machaon]|uniref:uncharacterized protein LOC106714953 n=1 Tax=Papilio machaon TaxID=76193 RepID=UPI001E665626|nr:uncharacterized protein LOC106714953 [Papilio machaon]
MPYLVRFAILLAAFSRNLPRYEDMDEDEQMLYRAAYETPTYDHYEHEENDSSMAKFDLLRDVVWAVNAKNKELKAFTKALAANLLSTKLKLKELIASGILVKKPVHVHDPPEKKKPSYDYQTAPQQYEPYAPQHTHNPYHGY